MTEPSTFQKPLNITRYKHVNKIISGDRLLSSKLGKNKPVSIPLADGSSEIFPAEIVYVAHEISKKGVDPKSLSRNEILSYGHQMLVESTPDISDQVFSSEQPAAKAPVKASTVKVKPAPSSEPKGSTVPPEPALQPPPTLKAVQKADPVKPAPARPAPAPAALKPKLKKSVASEYAAAVKPTKSVGAALANLRPGIPHVPGLCIMNLGHGILTLLEPHVAAKDAEAVELHKTMVNFVDRVYNKTALPGSAEKEKEPGVKE